MQIFAARNSRPLTNIRAGKSPLVPLMIAGWVLVSFSNTASAGPFGFFANSVSITGVYDIDSGTETPPAVDGSSDPAGGPVTANSSASSSVGTASAQAQASLSAGTLKASGVVESILDIDPPNAVNAYSTAAATIADSFRFFDNNSTSPFQWSSTTEATFTMNFSGSVTTQGAGDTRASAYLILNIYEPGAIALLQNGVSQAEINNQFRLSQNIFNVFGNLFPLGRPAEALPATVDFSFTPESNFDWLARFIVTTSINSGAAMVNADFLNSAELSFSGPDGARTFSASGLFPDTQGVSGSRTRCPWTAVSRPYRTQPFT